MLGRGTMRVTGAQCKTAPQDAKLAAIFVDSLPTPAYSFSRTFTLTFHGIKPVVTPSTPVLPAAKAVCNAPS